MAQISNITLPNGTKYNLKGSVYTVIGTQTAATGSWTGNLTSLDALYDGLTIAYYLPYAGSGNATLDLTLANSTTTGAINCYYAGNTRLTTHYGAGSVIFLTYYSAGSIKVAGTATTDARWIAGQDYHSDNNVKQNNNTSNADYRLLLSYNANDTTETKQAYKSTNFKANPSTGTLTATTFSGAFSGSGANITSLNASNVSSGTLSADRLATSGATAGSYGDSAAQTPGYGSTFKVPYITVDNKGRVTGISEHTVKIPASDNTNTTYNAGTGLSLSSTTFKAKLRSETALTNDSAAATETSGRVYPVVPDKSGYLAVNVPWTNVNSSYAPKASPALTGTPTAPTAANGTNNTQIATTAFVMNAFTANDAMVFKGTIGSSGATVTALPDTHSQGWTYRVITAGTYAGKVCEIGDMIICMTDGTSANNDHWTVVQTNIDGAVIGPTSATSGNIALFDGTTGKLIKNSSYSPSSFATSGHTHTTTLATDTGTSSITLAYGGKYKLTTGGTNVIFTMPASDNTNTLNTAGSTDTSSKIFLIGATSQAANPQTYSDNEVYVTSGVLQTKNAQATVVVAANTANSGTAGGLALYGTSPTDYGIAFRNTSNGGKHGGVQGDWAQYHYMTGATNRGWVFKHATSGNVASVDGVGNIVANGAVTVGGNTTNTSGCKMQYNTTTDALDFIFS